MISISIEVITSVTFFNWVTSLLGPFILSPNHSIFQVATSNVESEPIFGTWEKPAMKELTAISIARINLLNNPQFSLRINSVYQSPNEAYFLVYLGNGYSRVALNLNHDRLCGLPCLLLQKYSDFASLNWPNNYLHGLQSRN